MSHWKQLRLMVLTAFVAGLAATSAHAVPRINNLSLRGLQIGKTTTITITGSDLAPEPKFLLPVPEVQVAVQKAEPNQVIVDVTVPESTPPGIIPLRIARDSGISTPVLIGVDRLPQKPMAANVELPVALHGAITGTAVATTSFQGTKGQRVVVDVEARRLGSRLNPVVELRDSRRVPIQWAQESLKLSGDARLEMVLPADGTYMIVLHDALYQGANPGFFRLKVGDLIYADFAVPTGVQKGQKANVLLAGSVPEQGRTQEVSAGEVQTSIPAPLPTGANVIGPAPPLSISRLPEVAEVSTADQLQEVQAPAVVSGQLSEPGQVDKFKIVVQPGKRYRFDLYSNRLGSPLDGVLRLQNEQGGQLAAADDRPQVLDPLIDYTTKAEEKAVVAVISDLLGRGGSDLIYRLEIQEVPPRDFDLIISANTFQIPRQGVALLQVDAIRRGYNGPIKLELPGLFSSALVSGAEIPAGRTRALLTIGADAQQAFLQQVTTVRGHSVQLPNEVVCDALVAATPATRRSPWLRSDVGLAITPPAPLQIAWVGSETELPSGFNFTAKFKVDRQNVNAPVRLSLLTSQIPPVIADGQQKGQPDVAKTLRLDGTPQLAAGQSEGEVSIIVPTELPPGPYDFVLRGELLGADGKPVGEAMTASRRLNVVQPLQLQVAGQLEVKAKSGDGPTDVITGKLRRVLDLAAPVTLTLTGLPKELPAPSVVLESGKTEFQLPVSFPFGSQTGEYKAVNLVASATLPDNRVLTSNQVPVKLTVVEGNPPPPPGPLYRVFEDERFFLALLFEGGGKGELETTDRLSGQTSLKIAGNQRFRTSMPAWGFKITEKPKEGEFRYIRFAWKKTDGDSILLQLNANGSWGPQKGVQGPSFRYVAGPNPHPFNVAALQLDSQLPQTWQVVTRDLFADFGEFSLTGIALTPGEGGYGLFDHIYLARSLDDFEQCPEPIQPQQPLAIFEDESEFLAKLTEGSGQLSLDPSDKFAGAASLKVTPEQRFNPNIPGLGIKIRENPGEGEYRYLRYAWKKKGGTRICLQINHDGRWGPGRGAQAKFRYDSGTGPESYSAAIRLEEKLPEGWEIVTRDLYADFGEFTFTGLALSPIDGEFALFDHIYLAKTPRDFDLVHPQHK